MAVFLMSRDAYHARIRGAKEKAFQAFERLECLKPNSVRALPPIELRPRYQVWAANDAPLFPFSLRIVIAADNPSQKQTYKNKASEYRPADKLPWTFVIVDSLT